MDDKNPYDLRSIPKLNSINPFSNCIMPRSNWSSHEELEHLKHTNSYDHTKRRAWPTKD